MVARGKSGRPTAPPKNAERQGFAFVRAFVKRVKNGDRLTARDIDELSSTIAALVSNRGKATPELARSLDQIDREGRFTNLALTAFQDLLGRVGVDSSRPLCMPRSDEPYWFRFAHPLKNHRSHPELPSSADIVIIGAGLTGASAAYHLRDAARAGRRVIVIDKGFPACEASGRNAGNFELLPENSVGVYEGFARERHHFLRQCYPSVADEILRLEAERQAALVLGFALRNRDRLRTIVEREKVDCDYSPKGWLYLAHTEQEEQAICDEVAMAAEQDQRIEIWSRMKIRREVGFERDFLGRFIPDDGTYHPFKFVYGILQLAVDAGVELYTGVAVTSIHADGAQQLVHTDQGSIRCNNVIAATNAFIGELFPELRSIRPALSQISVTEFVPDRCRGRVITSEEGPVYFNQPRRGTRDGLAPLLLGGGPDRLVTDPNTRSRSRRVHQGLLQARARFFPEVSRRPFSTEWVGPMALTPDQLPAIGLLRPGVIIAAGYNGYGGSYCVAAGEAVAALAATGALPDWVPEDLFSPKRLLSHAPLFLGDFDGLWCYACSLCAQLRGLVGQIAEALTEGIPDTGCAVSDTALPRRKRGVGESDRDALRSLRHFCGFTTADCDRLLSLSRQQVVAAGTTLATMGQASAACFILLSGSVRASISVQGSHHLVGHLGPGDLVGESTMIDGDRCVATYSTDQATRMLELSRECCEQLFSSRSPLAYKLLSAMTGSLVASLRAAHRQLQRLSARNRLKWAATPAKERKLPRRSKSATA